MTKVHMQGIFGSIIGNSVRTAIFVICTRETNKPLNKHHFSLFHFIIFISFVS